MIITVTPNPSIDRTITVDHLERGGLFRSTDEQVDPGGKGVNVVRVLSAAGIPATAVLPVGGREGQQMVSLLHDQGIAPATVAVDGDLRVNVAIGESDGTQTKINGAGPTLSADEVARLLDMTGSLISGGSWLLGCGSLPQGVTSQFWTDLIRIGRAAGVRTAIDTSGSALRDVLAAGPDLVKPNVHELADVTGRAVRTLGEAVDAARGMIEDGARAVLASLGGDGALYVTRDIALHGQSPAVVPVSTVGAGDSMLAGFVGAARGDFDAIEALRAAIAHGAAAVQLPGSQLPTPTDLHPDLVVITDAPDLGRPLNEPAIPEESTSKTLGVNAPA